MNVLRGLASVVCLAVVLGGEANTADPPKPKGGPLGMKFVPLPKGTFYMGWDGNPAAVKKTEIKEDFEIAVHTVTQGQWTELMGKNPSWFSRTDGGKNAVKDITDEDLKQFPVESVSWDDCQEFVKKLNEKEKGKGYVYRLPTDAEWEYACRGGATTKEECSYFFYLDRPTNDISSKQANFNGDFPFGNGAKGPNLGRTTKVGSYAPNSLGLYDMHGNVKQWTDSPYANDGITAFRSTRGGSYDQQGGNCRAALRYRGTASYRFDQSIGCRLVRTPSAPAGE